MLKELLEAQVERWATIGFPDIMTRFVLKHGKPFTPHRYLGKLGTPKECFTNATHAIEGGFTYVEGIAVHKEIQFPFHHAWVTDSKGERAYDVTVPEWQDYEYFGITFDRKTLWKELERNGVYGLLDTGFTINVDLMYKLDPAFEAEVEAAIAAVRKQA